jgi:hypothetical protein
LWDLALTASALAPPTQHRALIAKASRPRSFGHARADDACDLLRHVGPQCDHGAGFRLHETQEFVRSERAEAALDHRGVLEDRERHQLVAVESERIQQPTRECRLRPSFRRQQIAHARRQRVGEASVAVAGRQRICGIEGRRGGSGSQSRRRLPREPPAFDAKGGSPARANRARPRKSEVSSRP